MIQMIDKELEGYSEASKRLVMNSPMVKASVVESGEKDKSSDRNEHTDS